MSKGIRFIEIGANLTDPIFNGVYRGVQAHTGDFKEMLQRTRNAGVEKIIVTAGTVKEAEEAIKLVNTYENLFMTVGCHPTRCKEFEKDPEGPDGYYQKLLNIAKSSDKVVAIGECGLDYDRLYFCPKATQLKYFERQFDLAEETGLPMFLHNRNTGNDFMDLIQKHRHRFKNGIMHSITCTMEEMERAVSLDLYLGINGCSLKTHENLEVAKKVPIEKLMLETDAPWCDIRPTHASYKHLNLSKEEELLYKPPTRKKEKFELGFMVKGRNEPCCIGQVLHVLASIRDENPEELAETIYKNTCEGFNLKHE
ncbi:putative deoxyribonuclease TATDN1-like protein [Rhizophagus irregularis]|uniref:3'-5'-exodeoxyribonuclease n=5 Tax=Rhizophagus irregularis TaxID=588596 RepID=A0A015LRK0_RHIIW|nr:putative deoxyribonuclease TATDN1-like protein [Rhizophagus irregularis DAOM 181602=DAOM 197198]EXX75316.1 3'-5'-exodeoxyribonuclease [Rhizophagus irregularis DAOM 197198w]PKC16615.1 putative deoxyribonuclease TATDN1-like protein [Rhizophagus irregularis]PKC56708.1 putative deoxyribonuclease TATDN1-like protein [Rhizophagus irregularis]PKY26196.1 putative deoxyribonuclease TATDN1-like protein [Rhizophagus irregularis]POG82546.1 putative deoxyribonuclease TATDN1-like protein [Rhizophagus irr|eukprot:XP_025189412.1 putative deoxyribonuclease TATDN1-like protein [Rhizophagus irregularis DAOM 181602=DAOM 197198]